MRDNATASYMMIVVLEGAVDELSMCFVRSYTSIQLDTVVFILCFFRFVFLIGNYSLLRFAPPTYITLKLNGMAWRMV